jgi:tRNA U34 2-thiouridine synthase MnmA/TrmU
MLRLTYLIFRALYRIKFRHFYDYAVNTIGCDAIATGHYARNSYGEDLERAGEGRPALLLKSYDRTKDQTFFLSQMPQEALQRTLFPVGELTKPVGTEMLCQRYFFLSAQIRT